MQGDNALRAFAERLRQLDRLPGGAAKIAAPYVEKAARASAARGTTPEGTAWAPRKEDAGRPMVDAASHITASASGDVITIKLTGPDVIHHYGNKREPARRVIPDAGAGIPPLVLEAVARAAAEAFDATMSGKA